MKPFIREKKIESNKTYREVDIFSTTDIQPKISNRTKKEISRPAQRNLNDKNSKRYFVQLAEANFTEGDWAIELTYFDAFYPETVEDADREMKNCLRRIQSLLKKKHLPPLKYLAVTSDVSGETGKPVRIHHHLFIKADLSFDEIREIWRRPKKKGEKEGARIGRINIDRLIPDEHFDISGKAYYFGKQRRGRKRWFGSLNLKKPVRLPNADHKFTHRQIDRLAAAVPFPLWGKDINSHPNIDFWKKQYPGWRIVSYIPEWNNFRGWAIYLKLRRQ